MPLSNCGVFRGFSRKAAAPKRKQAALMSGLPKAVKMMTGKSGNKLWMPCSPVRPLTEGIHRSVMTRSIGVFRSARISIASAIKFVQMTLHPSPASTFSRARSIPASSSITRMHLLRRFIIVACGVSAGTMPETEVRRESHDSETMVILKGPNCEGASIALSQNNSVLPPDWRRQVFSTLPACLLVFRLPADSPGAAGEQLFRFEGWRAIHPPSPCAPGGSPRS